MVQSNKILTVSYGTFSCKLEGFDDSFDTMKAIAEYFRDLAADDRYFGAEPPTPDAEMLARIAEREIARRVEAHMDDQGVFLRAAPAAAVAPVADAASDVVETAKTGLADMRSESAQEVAEPEQADVEATAEDAMAEPETDAEEAIEPIAADAFENAEPVEDVIEDTQDASETAMTARIADVVEEAADVAEAPVEPSELDVMEAQMDAQDELDDVDVVAAAAPAPDAESVAAKLARIRAVVSSEVEEETPDYSEDQHADDLASHDDEPQAQEEETSIVDASDAEPLDLTQGLLDRVKSTVASGDLDDVVAEAEELAEPEAADALADISEDVSEPELAETESAVEAALEPEAAPEVDAVSETAATSPQEEPAPKTVVARRPGGPVRVVRVKRGVRKAAAATTAPAAQEAASEEPQKAETPDPLVLGAGARIASDTASGGLSQEDESELLRELAEVEAELDETIPMEGASDEPSLEAAELDEAFDAPEAEPEPEETSVTRSIRSLTRRVRMTENGAGEKEQDVSRLMAETEAQLDEPEGRNRRSAIAHLRAAVAATRDDRQSQNTADASETREAQFREDLDAVRPRHEEVEARKAAPLKLVAEQRVDLEAADGDARGPTPAELRAAPSMQSVRPRRIAPRRGVTSEAAPETEDTGEGFLAYAEETGAQGLAELLEAAAAYMTLVEKRPQFSRPQLMSKVREAETQEFSRDDRLRFFGQLLRDGKIEKTANGRFTASDSIGFQPDERAAG